MDSEQPARRANGTLKDASELDWVYSPSADTVVLPVLEESHNVTSIDDQAIIEAPIVGRRLRHHGPSVKYMHAIAAEQQDSDEDVVPEVNVVRKRKVDKTDIKLAQPGKKQKNTQEAEKIIGKPSN